MQLDSYISELLYTTDCVIIPGLGGFVANKRGAFLNPAQNTFSPPSKRVAFNASLRSNDGLLAYYIGNAMDITYAEAIGNIQHYVDDIYLKLNSGNSVTIEKIGALSYDSEKHLQFEPDVSMNYLADSFGLTTFHSPSIRRDEPASGITRKLNPKTKQTDSGKKSAWRLLELVPAAAILFLLAFNPNVIPTLNSGLSSLNPFEVFKTKTIEVDRNPSVPKDTENAYPETKFTEAPVTNENVDDGINNEASVVESATTEINQDSKETATEQEPVALNTTKSKNEAPRESTKVVLSTTESSSSLNVAAGNHYVIGGCFRIYDNAVKFRDDAIAKGFKAEILGKDEHGLNIVSLFSSNDINSARSEMARVKESLEKGAWMLSK